MVSHHCSRSLRRQASLLHPSFPDLGNLVLDDMGDNVNAGGAAPAAPYVILSFLFEIVIEFMFLVCALDVICSSAILVRMLVQSLLL